MPHQRRRCVLPIFEKRLSLFPVVGLLGARQVGKSTFIRNLLGARRKIEYVTLDREEERKRAENAPTLFIQSLSGDGKVTICIDEVQKAPVLFDAIKAEVDERKRPGRFVITGSTEFSRKTGVRESLTGRIALLRMFPLCLSEILDSGLAAPLVKMGVRKKMTGEHLRDIKTWIDRGGMPGICFVRDENSRQSLLESWIETTCFRDTPNFAIPKFSPELARRILFAVAVSDLPTRGGIANLVNKLPRQIERYIEAFKALHVLYEIEPFPTGTGKPFLIPFDAGIAKACGARESKRLQIWFLNECLSQFSAFGMPTPDIFYYRTAKGSTVDFIVKGRDHTAAFMLTEVESPSTYYMRTAEAFSLKHPDIPLYVLTPGLRPFEHAKNIWVIPWEAAI